MKPQHLEAFSLLPLHDVFGAGLFDSILWNIALAHTATLARARAPQTTVLIGRRKLTIRHLLIGECAQLIAGARVVPLRTCIAADTQVQHKNAMGEIFCLTSSNWRTCGGIHQVLEVKGVVGYGKP